MSSSTAPSSPTSPMIHNSIPEGLSNYIKRERLEARLRSILGREVAVRIIIRTWNVGPRLLSKGP
ncbi:hypothetical protein N7462_003939 [Penicillium macrosclerotiorum]|uniref:uncharacterized protein n=1 Tax=Penicillium macrosclerotiorum TaxID=303699 RepID=UPI0025474F2E|nr:uncharacterized protein N7462_003939 [Penicillium macrosclerotiorum]KAJ5689547.1 hypothetical protein N7462_003939 [Penicillium macrosclerotiorum]